MSDHENDHETHLQIPLDSELAAAIARRAQQAGRGDDIEGFVHDVLADTLIQRDWFYGVLLLLSDSDGPDWQWRAMAWTAEDARVVDGALVLTDAAGRTTLALAPGRWKEVTKRSESHRSAFEYTPPPDDIANAFKAAARAQQGWPPLPSAG